MTTRTLKSTPRAAAIALIAAVGFAGACVEDESANPPRADIGALSCDYSNAGPLRADGKVTNHSSKTSTYVIDVEFEVDGFYVDTRTEWIEELAPGETAPLAVSVADAPEGDVQCRINAVERFKA